MENYRVNRPRPNYHQQIRKQSARATLASNILTRIPDLLTLSRAGLGFALAGTAVIGDSVTIWRDVWLLVLAWTTDIFDGHLARAFRVSGKSWLGSKDVFIDMFFSTTVLFYLTVTGLLPAVLALVYLAVWAGLFLKWGFLPMLAQVFQNPIYAAFVYFAVVAQPLIIIGLMLWALMSMIFFWRRALTLLQNGLHTLGITSKKDARPRQSRQGRT
jgi:phosphatidylglycerophosphate synthase